VKYISFHNHASYMLTVIRSRN